MKTSPRIAPSASYSIGDLCRELGVTRRAIRFYEEQELIFPGRRGLQRIYSSMDRARLGLIVRSRRVGLSIAQIHQMLTTYDRHGEDAQTRLAIEMFGARVQALTAQRSEIDAMVATLQAECARLEERLRGRVAA